MFVPDCGGDGGDVAAVGADRARAAGAEAALARRRGDLERDRVDTIDDRTQQSHERLSSCFRESSFGLLGPAYQVYTGNRQGVPGLALIIHTRAAEFYRRHSFGVKQRSFHLSRTTRVPIFRA